MSATRYVSGGTSLFSLGRRRLPRLIVLLRIVLEIAPSDTQALNSERDAAFFHWKIKLAILDAVKIESARISLRQ